jgi:cytoskeleton protein RodZ
MSETPLTNEAERNVLGASAGTLLRQAREAAGMHIGALAVSLKVPVKKIEALESDRLDLLPDAVFARALAASICRTLKVDGTLILASLPQGTLPRLKTDESSLNTTYLGSGVAAQPGLLQQLSKPMALIGLVLVAAAAFLLIAPGNEVDKVQKQSEQPQPPQPLQAISTAPSPLPEPVASSPSNVAVQQPLPIEAKPPERNDAVGQTTLSEPGKAANLGPETGATKADGIVVFAAKGVSWVEVTDGAGVVQLRKTLAAGETAGASGQAPFKVIVGRVDSVNVKVRGKEFDLSTVSRDNVARFEVR